MLKKNMIESLGNGIKNKKEYKKICDDCGLLEGNVGTPVPKGTYDFYEKQFNKKCGHVVVYGVLLCAENDL